MVEGTMREGVLKTDQVEIRDPGGERILQYLIEMLHNTIDCGIGLQNIWQYRKKSGIMT